MDQPHSTMPASNFSSFPGPGPGPDPTWDTRGLVPAVVLSLCFCLGVPGNIAVIILKPNWEHLSSLSQSLMLNLAVSDLLCLLTLPLWIYILFFGWTFSLGACKLLTCLVYCSIYGSQLTVTGLSLQRYLVVVHQRKCHQVRKSLMLVLLWLVAFILSIPALVVRQLKRNHQWTRCQPQYSSDTQWVAVLVTEAILGFLSLSFVAFSYICLHRKVNQAAFFNNLQTTRLITSIIVSYFILWVPYHTVNVLGAAAICLKNQGLLKFCSDTWNIFGALTFVNSCLNPLLYAFTSRKVGSICQKQQHRRSFEFPSQTSQSLQGFNNINI